ncbi:hypothetical protein HYU45_03625 [Candidatus Daviesbacteria bacterium]|nr:hypothetical protein [Candidatus Daviesbacteria bacterium]
MKKYIYLHPFLFAVYPALFLYAQNQNLFRENVLALPLLLSLTLTGIIYSLSLLILKEKNISALICLAFIFIFFSYSRIKEFFKEIQHPDQVIIAGIFLFLIILIYFLLRYKNLLKTINKALSFFSLILLSLAIISIASFEVKSGRILLSLGSTGNNPETSQSARRTPDIYYFVLDRYAGEKTLKQYGFDNSSFYEFLARSGFYIATDSTSNYPKTFLSLGSTLNMEYLNYLTEKTNGGGTSDESFVTPLVANNKIIKFLKKKGYSYIHVGSGWDPTRSNKNAEVNFVMTGGRYLFKDEFLSGFLQTTLAAPILKKIYPDPTAVSQNPKNNDHRSRVLYEFEALNQIPEIPGPKFVFAHILAPHDPYVLGEYCEGLSEKVVAKRGWIENYLNQLRCTNQKTMAAIEKILAHSRSKPVIIIQADEGPMPMKYPVPFDLAWKKASDDTLREKFPILNAYLLPGLKDNPVYPSITPVNSFRIVFNAYFDTSYLLLPDKNYVFEDKDSYYKFIDVTERLKTSQ